MPRHSRVTRKRTSKPPPSTTPRAQATPSRGPRRNTSAPGGNSVELLEQYQDTLRGLAQNEALTNGELPSACQAITEACAHLLQVERASIWLFDKNRMAISLADLYERGAGQHRADSTLKVADYPS